MKMVDTVLLYIPEGSKRGLKIKPAILRTGARIRSVGKEQFSCTIGELLGFSEEELAQFTSGTNVTSEGVDHDIDDRVVDGMECNNLDEEVMVLWNFTGPKIDQMLSHLKKAGAGKVNLKAVVTPSNIKWTFEQLVHELKKEHEAFK